MFFSKTPKELSVSKEINTSTLPVSPKRTPVFEKLYREAIEEATIKFKLAVTDHADEWVQDESRSTHEDRVYTYSIGLDEIFSISVQSRFVTINCKDHGLCFFNIDRHTGQPDPQYKEIHALCMMVEDAIVFKRNESNYAKNLADINEILGLI
jgi:hypothetical protein